MTTTNRDLHLGEAMCKNVSETGLLVAYYAASLLRFQVAGMHPDGIASWHMMCFAFRHVASRCTAWAGRTMTNNNNNNN